MVEGYPKLDHLIGNNIFFMIWKKLDSFLYFSFRVNVYLLFICYHLSATNKFDVKLIGVVVVQPLLMLILLLLLHSECANKAVLHDLVLRSVQVQYYVGRLLISHMFRWWMRIYCHLMGYNVLSTNMYLFKSIRHPITFVSWYGWCCCCRRCNFFFIRSSFACFQFESAIHRLCKMNCIYISCCRCLVSVFNGLSI